MMDEIKQLERQIARLRKGMTLRRILRASLLTALFSVYGFFLLVRVLPMVVHAAYVAW